MNNVKVKFKKLNDKAVLPSYATPGDAGADLVATSKEFDQVTSCIVMGTGLALEIPDGYVGLLFPRSSIYKTPFMLANAVGVLDSQFRGEIKAIFRPVDNPKKNYEIGDRVVQLVVMPISQVEFEEVSELSDTQRGTGGFGSTGV